MFCALLYLNEIQISRWKHSPTDRQENGEWWLDVINVKKLQLRNELMANNTSKTAKITKR